MKILLTLFVFAALTVNACIQSDSTFVETKMNLQTNTGEIFGTLTTPEKFDKGTVALLIAGSGPTNRNGNSSLTQNNSLKMLARQLAQNGIASVRYDKRGIAESKSAGKHEADLRFENYVTDAKEWIHVLKQDPRFLKVVIIGHSEGSLIGMMAAADADKFISIAGAGQSADKILKEQLSSQLSMVQNLCFPIIDSLKNGKTVENVNPMLSALFRPDIQPYLISWFKYDPQLEIKKLTIPVLILQGTEDLQVKEEDAKRLARADPKAKLIFIKKMNHVLKITEGNKQANMATYRNPDLPISAKLIKSITAFIRKD